MAVRVGTGILVGAGVAGLVGWWFVKQARARTAEAQKKALWEREWREEEMAYMQNVPATATGSVPPFIVADLIAKGVISDDAIDAFIDPTIDKAYKLMSGPKGSVWIVTPMEAEGLVIGDTDAGIKGYGAYSQYWEVPVSPNGIGPGGTDPTTVRQFTSQKPQQRAPVSFVDTKRPWTGTW